MGEFVKTATAETRKHYRTKEVRETIQRVSLIGENTYSRWLVGDNKGWYNYQNKCKNAYSAMNQHYDKVIKDFRTLHYTLSYFNPDLFQYNFNATTRDEAEAGKLFSKESVYNYTFGIDIDTIDLKNGHGINIHDTEVKSAVEAMATFFVNDLKKYCPKSINCLYSGGGIYVMVHHKVFEGYLKDYKPVDMFAYKDHVDILTDALNQYVIKTQENFYNQYPEHANKVKADSINGAKRVFKTIFSLHKKHPYAVIPLNPNNIIIDFEKATLPLSKEVLATGAAWYTEYEDGEPLLNMLKSYFYKSTKKQKETISYENGEGSPLLISDIPYINIEDYPPCVQNILKMDSCGVGATRALAFIASFLGQVGYPEKQALDLWTALATKWQASTSNIFESWFKTMHCPTCKKLRTKGPGYPRIDIHELKACKPNSKCMCVDHINPVYYVDKTQYCAYLDRELMKGE